MGDTLKFLLLMIIGAVGVFFSFLIISPSTNILAIFGGGVNSSLSANIISVVGNAKTNASENNSETFFYMSYDNLKNIHKVYLPTNSGVRITDVFTENNYQNIFLSTTKGLFSSENGGLNWKQIEIAGSHSSIYEPADISSSTVILDLFSTGKNKEIYFSIFRPSANDHDSFEGSLYKTNNNFSTIELITSFKKEAVYSMYVQGEYIYLGMSNGQFLKYNIKEKTIETLQTFPKQIKKIDFASDGFFYISLEGGHLYRSKSLYSKFSEINIPGGWWLSSGSVEQFTYDELGNIYIRTDDGIYRSSDSGETFSIYNDIPLFSGDVDVFGVKDGNLFILSKNRAYMSSYNGIYWKVVDVYYSNPIWNSYFIGGGKVILTQ